MDDRDVAKKLDKLLQRIEDIEGRLDAMSPREAVPPKPAPPPPLIANRDDSPASTGPSETAKPVPTHEPSTVDQPSEPVSDPSPASSAAQVEDTLPSTPASKTTAESERSQPPASVGRLQGAFSNLTIENLVGGRLYAILGSLLVIIATGILLKLAWDAKLFNLLPDQLKCVLAAAFGAGLVAGGELARRRISAWASIGLTTAGLGVLYATSYTAWGVFNVIPSGVGFALLMATTALGIFIGARAGLVSIAALSLIAGYLSPLMFSDVKPSPYTLPVYLIALLCVGLVLCARHGGRYAVLRSISWWGTVAFGTVWLLMNEVGAPTAHMVFIACVWSAIQLELVYSASRSRLGTLVKQGDESLLAAWKSIRPIASSITATAWAIALALWTFHEENIEVGVWLVPLGFATALIAVSQFKIGMLTILRTQPISDLHRLTTVFLIQAGALIFVAIAVAFEDWTGVVAWTVLGLGAVLAGERIRSRALVVYGMITQAIGGTNLMVLKWWMVQVVDGDLAGGFVITRGTVLMIVSALGWLITGMLIRRSSTPGSAWRITAHVLMGLGITMSFIGFINDQSTNLQIVWVVVMLAAMIMMVGTYLGSSGLKSYSIVIQGWVFLLLVAGLWWSASPQIQFWEVTLTAWFWPTIALSTVASCSALILLRFHKQAWDVVAIALTAFAFTVLALGFIHQNTAPTSLIVIWILLSGCLLALHGRQPRLHLSRIGLAGALATIVPLAVSVTNDQWNGQTTALFLTRSMWWSLLVVAAIWSAAKFEHRLNPEVPTSRRVSAVAVGIGTCLLFVTSSLEVATLAEKLLSVNSGLREAVSIWWGLFAIALLILGFKRNVNILRYAGLGLLAIAALKAVLFDLASVSAVWRAMSFLILGLLMLGVGVGYARAMSHTRNSQEDPRP